MMTGERRNQSAGPRTVTFEGGSVSSVTGTGLLNKNKITTSKYTWYTFAPKNLWEQLHKFGNVYFLCISAIMFVGEKTPLFVGTIKGMSTLATLLVMMSATAFVALLDDLRRKQADAETNNHTVLRIENGGLEKKDVTWAEVQIGDILEIKQNNEFPADMVPLYCSGEEGCAYVSTCNLDGETNLKLKVAPPSTQREICGAKGQTESFANISGFIEAESPSANILDFSGSLKLTRAGDTAAQVSESLTIKQFCLRGTVLRNTQRCIGIVVYTGPQTRMVMNSQRAPLKQSNLERVTNSAMLLILLAQASLAFMSDVTYLLSKDTYSSFWYLYPPEVILPDWIAYWLTFFVLYSNLMPISLYPTMEFCNLFQAYFIKNDIEIYDKKLEFSAHVRSSNLCQELGQVCYIFSDKTGTLTQNVMELKRLSIAGKQYGSLVPNEIGFNGGQDITIDRKGSCAASIDQFCEVLAVCHTVVALEKKDGTLEYEGESPDEKALVSAMAAPDVGWKFAARVGKSYHVENPDRRTKDYEIIAVNVFDSTRKRMSVVVKVDGSYYLFAKGADNVMMEIGQADSYGPQGQAKLQQDLDVFARSGLRTLVIGRRKLDEVEVSEWRIRFQKAQTQVEGRDEALRTVAGELEKQLHLVGATAIEDKLQDQVPETIVKIRDAGIKLWVLTGDKLETAREIGFSTKVLTRAMNIQVLSSSTSDEVAGNLDGILTEVQTTKSVCALMVTGASVAVIQGSVEMTNQFLDIAGQCSVLIACRVSPSQKAALVRMVRNGVTPQPVTLAVGDGANDVPMIQEAQVGVGILGQEGRQAVNNSDFAIGQFRFLQRLLLVHGRWNYRRTCKFTLFTFWRNMVAVLMMFYYTFLSGFSGTSLFEDWIRMSFNFLCSFPIMATGCFDKDVPAQTVLRHPVLYEVGRLGHDLSVPKTMQTLLSAFLHSMILYWVTAFAMPNMEIRGSGDYYTFGTAVFTCMIVDMNYRVAFLSTTWNVYTIGAIILSFVFYVVYLLVYPSWRFVCDLLEPNMYLVPFHMMKNLIFWFCLVAVPLLAMILDMFQAYIWHTLRPDLVERATVIDSLAEEKADYDDSRDQIGYQNLIYRGGKPAHDDRNSFGEDLEVESEEEDDAYATESEVSHDGDLDLSDLDLSDFAQQRSWSFRFYVSWRLLLFVAIVIGFVLSALGAFSLLKSREISQIRITYSDHHEGWKYQYGTRDDETFKRCEGLETPFQCNFTVTVPTVMKAPVHLQYVVGPFYQNYYDYMRSEVIQELEGEQVSAELRESKCENINTRETQAGFAIRPCGMKATSLFNDTFDIIGHDIRKTGIAWRSDIERYNNPSGYPVEPPRSSWLYDRYPFSVPESQGVKNEGFVSWMRPAALPYVGRLYGFIDSDLQAGEELQLVIYANYPTESLGAYKQLVLTEVNIMGTRSDAFGALLLVGSLISFVIAALVVCVRVFKLTPKIKQLEGDGEVEADDTAESTE